MDALKILMVDDEARMRKLVKDFLTNKGFSVVEAGDGEEALEIFFAQKDIALILLDVMMPKMDGWEVLNTIRKYSKVPVIMLTARSEERDELQGFSLGVDEYISKPFSPKILVARVEALLRRTNAVSADIMNIGGICTDKAAHRVTIDGKEIELSFKEFELLTYFAENQGIALSREKILNNIGLFIGLMAIVLLAVCAMNSFFLEKYYLNDKLNILQDTYTQINAYAMEKAAAGEDIMDDLQSLYSKDGEQNEITRLIRNINEKYNITIVVVDSTNGETYPSFWDGRFLADRVQQYILGRRGPKTETLVQEENYTIEKSFDKHAKSFYLQNWGFFEDNKTIFIMSMPIASIHESVDLSNRFMVYIGLIALAAGSVIMYFAGKKITSPILSLAALSERMSELDFDARYTGDSEDEIGVLGKSMNTLSEKLKETIGELKTANNELQKDIEEKIRIDEARKEFIANVSHELKTPIALIQGYAEGLTEGMAEDPESRDYYCEVIQDEAGKMNKMVKQLLTLTALEFGNDKPVMEQFDLVTLINGVLSSAKILLQQKGAQVFFDASEPVMVWADEFKIEEVVTNYLNNAMNHLDGEKWIEIRLEKNDKEVKVTVFNTGQNIPEEDLGKLWTKFYKVDKARTRAYGGSGIGLSIVKAIMDSHNKACGVQNVKDGVEFWFTLDCSV